MTTTQGVWSGNCSRVIYLQAKFILCGTVVVPGLPDARNGDRVSSVCYILILVQLYRNAKRAAPLIRKKMGCNMCVTFRRFSHLLDLYSPFPSDFHLWGGRGFWYGAVRRTGLVAHKAHGMHSPDPRGRQQSLESIRKELAQHERIAWMHNLPF